jgi:hypothetical protein
MNPGVSRDAVTLDASTLEALQQTLRLQSDLMMMFEQREQRMRTAFDQRMQTMSSTINDTRRQIEIIVNAAGPKIAASAESVLAPMVARYDREVAATSTQLRRAGRTVWMWFGAAAAILLLVVVVGASVLGYYRRELAVAQEALHRYEDALPVLRAYAASEAVLCGERLCVNVEPGSHKTGDGRSYRQVKQRTREP